MRPRMVQAQVARDLWMAHALRQHAAQGAVLIAGNGHVRRDAGVPYWLQRLGQPQSLVIGYEEEGIPGRTPARPCASRCVPLQVDEAVMGTADSKIAGRPVRPDRVYRLRRSRPRVRSAPAAYGSGGQRR